MEIRVEQRMTGRELRASILAKYGSRDRLEAIARIPKEAVAKGDLVTLRQFEEDPRRLELDTNLVTISILEPPDIARLTPQRIRLLDQVAKGRGRKTLTRLCERLGRDKKNVSEDLHFLESLGLVFIERRGREISPALAGSRIQIVLETSAG